MSDSDLIKLYSGRILALAADIPLNRRLSEPGLSAQTRSPLCGSTVIVDLVLRDGRIVAFGQDVKACALGQAAASVLAANIIGRSRGEVEAGRNQLRAMLNDAGPVPEAPFDGLEVLLPARGFKNRHASIMLAFEATSKALAEGENAACA
ncbi:MAG: iron-sulfur cluster assembly scaffold protein [Paracoccaceae bacterium]